MILPLLSCTDTFHSQGVCTKQVVAEVMTNMIPASEHTLHLSLQSNCLALLFRPKGSATFFIMKWHFLVSMLITVSHPVTCEQSLHIVTQS